ncbi:MAG: ATP synthase F1 subunit delta [Clostridiales Family XIII bacterium]|jgi:ATP synthase F1 delta subunit|nr:ATP synthase F1 subunit delta [Clostridiales Family XIII bacterium]
MDTLTVANTYGRALFDAAADGGIVDATREELSGISGVFKENPDLRKLFLLPTIAGENKKAVAKRVFEGRISRELLNFICILIDKRRVGAWDGIVRCYEKLVDERDGFTKGVLYSVIPVEGETLGRFETESGKAIGKKVRLENRIDESLIGGVMIYVDGKLIDASIKGRLENLKQTLSV